MQAVAVVTGASAGIGEAIAARLLDEGSTVIALQRRSPCLKHDRLLYREVDLADVDAATSVTDEVAPRVMILIKGFAPAMRKAGFGHREHVVLRCSRKDTTHGSLTAFRSSAPAPPRMSRGR